MLGRSIRGPAELSLPRPPCEPATSETQYVFNLKQKLSIVHDFVRKHLRLTNTRTKDRYDRVSDLALFAPGEPVWIFQPRVPRGRTPKFRRPWTGPYRVMEKLTDVVYRVQRSLRSQPMTVNRFRMWKCTVQLPADWFATARADNRADAAAIDPGDDSAAADAAATEDPNDVTAPLVFHSATVNDSDDEYEDVDRSVIRGTDSRNALDTGQPQQLQTRSGRVVRRPLRFV